MGTKLKDLNNNLRERVLAAMGQDCEKKRGGNKGLSRKMSKPESAFYATVLLPLLSTGTITGVKYGGPSLPLDNGHRYTCDWTYLDNEGRRHCVEVKGPYKLRSERSARFAFDQAVLEYPDMKFLWVRQTKSGWEM